MNKEDLKIVAAMLFSIVASLLLGSIVFPAKITDRVISTLKREYVPGPYNPGFDPDKVPPSFKN
jgi:hypothetical protein